jgi:HRDC domain/RQC domain/Helix-turn-helix domain
MKSEAGIVESKTQNTYDLDITSMVRTILQTMADLGRPYGQNYIAQFVTADKFISFRQTDHCNLPTYGKLRSMNLNDAVCMIHHLIDVGYIACKEPDFITIALTDSGQAWLANPQPWTIAKNRVRYSAFEKFLRTALREHRRDTAERHERKPWEVISDYTLDRIVQSKPLNLDALSRLPGFDTRKCEQYGAGFVKTVQDVIEHYEVFQRASLMQKVKSPRYQQAKKLFQENVTIPEIASVMGLKIGTVCNYLRDLHAADQVDLVPWIERNINARSLYKGTEYFERVSRPRLKEAHNTLGLDYDTLLFCQLYVQDKHMRKQEAAMLKQDQTAKMAS